MNDHTSEFTSPETIPFPLQELFDTKEEIEKSLANERKIRLLLIDDHFDKFMEREGDLKSGPLCSLIEKLGLSDLFDLEMLGQAMFKKEDIKGEPGFYLGESPLKNRSDLNEQLECFDYRRFKSNSPLNFDEQEYLNDFIQGGKKQREQNTIYADFVYEKVKSTDFVLLDFILDEEDTHIGEEHTYLAFSFIQDIAKIKRNRKDTFTTWYFIASAVYDSVVKYTQSGLLAEHYESAVVNTGDDPTNEKRQIIFVYKLLTFIRSRIKNFENLKQAISGCSLFKNCQLENNCNSCLVGIDSLCQKYLAEYDENTRIFPHLEKESFKEIVELIQNIIRQFFWLPEADWAMIQRQIDLLNSRLKKREDFKAPQGKREPEFSCTHINNEIKKRSKIY